MPQSFCLFNDLTVSENLGYVAASYGLSTQEVEDVINSCELSNYRNVLAQRLSGGYKQLLSAAAAIINKPKLLILDEPTGAMDPLFRKKFWEILKRIHKQGATILVITHYLEELYECDRFVCLADGKIVFDGKIDELNKNGLVNLSEILNYCNEKKD